MQASEEIENLKDLVEDIDICLFCTNLKTGVRLTTRLMSAQKVDEEGNLWFFSNINSNENRRIKTGKRMQLFFFIHQKVVTWWLTARLKLLLTKIKQQNYGRHWLKPALKKARTIQTFLP